MIAQLSLADVRSAAARIADAVASTPTVRSAALSHYAGAEVFVKLEILQRTGAFKERGAANRILQLSPDQRAGGVIAISAGNHAQAVAYQGARLGIPTTIVMPETTPFTKIRRTRAFGARVLTVGDALEPCEELAREMIAREGLTMVHPYDDPAVVAGQGTIALEMLDAVPDLDVLVIPIGGGGLIGGIGLAAKSLRPSLRVVGVQTEAYPAMAARLLGIEPRFGGQTIAEGIAVKAPSDLTVGLARRYVDDVLLVGEEAIEDAVHVFLEDGKILAEGAAAAALAALGCARSQFAGKRVGLVACGGNIDTGLLANVIMRVRLREGRVVRMRIETNDRPGVLADVAQIIARHRANILEVVHQRLFSDVPSKNADIDITIETREPGDVAAIVAELSRSGYPSEVLESSSNRPRRVAPERFESPP